MNKMLLLPLIVAVLPLSQTLPALKPTFEVVSIKPASANTRGMSIETNRGRFVARGATLSFLVQYAHRLQPFQISGGPNWFDSDKFEIQARFDGSENVNSDDRLILKRPTVLVDRFKLRYHRDARRVPVYEVVIAKNGPKLRRSNDATPSSMRGGGGQLIARHASI